MEGHGARAEEVRKRGVTQAVEAATYAFPSAGLDALASALPEAGMLPEAVLEKDAVTVTECVPVGKGVLV